MRKKAISTIIIISLVMCFALTGCSSEKGYYNKGVKALEAASYDEAIENFTQAGEYEDSKEKIRECYYGKGIEAVEQNKYDDAIDSFTKADGYKDSNEKITESQHLLDVSNDETPPVVEGVDERIDVTCGKQFNLNDYLADIIKIEDDVTQDIKDYSVSCDKVYDRGTGEIDTMEQGEYEVTITAKDEAANVGEKRIILSINPVVVSEEEPTPVIYDGEYATIKLNTFKHGEIYEYSGMNGYYAVFDVENKCDEPIEVYWSMYTTVNDYQVGAEYELNKSIAPGKKGSTFTYIEDKNIPEEAGNFSQIDSIICIKKISDTSSFYRIPTTFYTNAAQ